MRIIFSGSASTKLASDIAEHTGIRLGKVRSKYFSNREFFVEILDEVSGNDIFIVQSICNPANDNLMELLILSDALRRSAVNSITAIIPYMGYARQDRKVNGNRVAIAAKLVANMLVTSGIEKIITIDLHSEQLQGFFDIPVEDIYAGSVLVEDLKHMDNTDTVIISPDIGGVSRCRNIANLLDTSFQIIDKYSDTNLINNIINKKCIIIDDIIDSAATLCNAAEILQKNGANSITAYVTHPVLSGDSVAKIQASHLEKLVVADTIPLSTDATQCDKIRQVSVAKLLQLL